MEDYVYAITLFEGGEWCLVPIGTALDRYIGTKYCHSLITIKGYRWDRNNGWSTKPVELPNQSEYYLPERKKDKSKPIRFDLIPWSSVLRAGQAFTEGTTDHEDFGWLEMDIQDCIMSTARHFLAYLTDHHSIDPGTGLYHSTLLTARCMMLDELRERYTSQ